MEGMMKMGMKMSYEPKGFDVIVRKMYALGVMAKAEHVNAATKSMSYAQHKAFGGFYEFLDEFTDRVAEHCIGMGYLVRVDVSMLECSGDVVSSANMVAKSLYDTAEAIEDEALCNMCGEFYEAIGKLKYMLRFQ